MSFKKYQHLERFGTSEVQGIELGTCFIFPKLDGTNASLWWDGKNIQAGSRNRHLDIHNDNAGFLNTFKEDLRFIQFFRENPFVRLYGEWLVPHSLKTYREDAWKKFYVFDVVDNKKGVQPIYWNFYKYNILLDKYHIDYIPPLAEIHNPTYDQLVNVLEKNTFLITDGEGKGEGVVIKNYDFKNRHNKSVWAKIVTSEFKEKHSKEMGHTKMTGKKMIEDDITDEYVTTALCEKVYAKIEMELKDKENRGFTCRDIPRLLNTIYYDVVNEECWNMVKKFKQPTINFKTLQHFIFKRIKQLKPEWF